MSTKEIKKTSDQMPSYIKQDSNRGNENVNNEDLQLPRIDVLQALSPQINKKKDEYIEGAEVGMLFNTLTGELHQEVGFTPISFVKRHLIWVDRKKDQSGGLRGVFDTIEEAETSLEQQEDSDKLEIVPTAEHLVLLDNGDEVILSMAKSRMKVSRKFNSLVRLSGGDRFSRRYSMKSVDDKGPKGEFQNIKIEIDGYPTEENYLKAEALYEAIQAGAKQAGGNYEGAPSGEASEEAAEENTSY